MAFGFDSFLDIVANVIGIILRLILVSWVGARSYTESMKWLEEDPTPDATIIAPSRPAPTPLPDPKPSDEPIHGEIAKARKELDQVQSELIEQMRRFDLLNAKDKQTEATLAQFETSKKKLLEEQEALAQIMAQRGLTAQATSQSLADLRLRGQKLAAEIKAVEALPAKKKQLRYHTPVSRTVHQDEFFFECQNGRVTFIDLPAFHDEIRDHFQEKAKELLSQWKIDLTTKPIGFFRLKYSIERQRDSFDALAPIGKPRDDTSFSYGVGGWEAEPIAFPRGENLETALSPRSDFRAVVDGLDGQQAVVTLWVYPDSFALFRRLRDYLYERDIEVAARPLPEGVPIRASRNGTKSRGQ